MKVLASACLAAALFALALPASADIPPPKKNKCTVSDTSALASGGLDGALAALGAVAVFVAVGRRRSRGGR
ncbi:MAG: hypothetical protein IPG04_18085 [Polyangiaceae bacterium]|jgi:hypothetical protein|nr:hypothetical protein [Polyangiaceae bacterium]